ncbi:hypothetical protein ND861_09615 [Leptospira sp. 2 VSF19]|uniref:Restriction endonuclease n=1 Tax=Leptospira soteropolitanensis TaxID=2950025 RepID=A0AAW5VDI6_9LEPT|nr:hypothetical protein [Leptospira soteropolitanensis]MCW7492537.1 hypothetical protein [Leptospira soteropolitanensis]MCW7500585.1 hypothetical protein [Leptospira soteropolitanensis]MCW7522745.1 hypothetical protein [Leptospira soteropolitanensis]MCW7526601.1 hypothetical protein [Leptospira soteropolitanensis]MCW7530555.1 hypothetical protein [Leptospira soteropolitanensis]
METQDLLNKLNDSIKKTLENLKSKSIETLNGNIISSWNETYKYGGTNIFETTFVDALVHSLSQEEKTIGWEVNYPWNTDGKPWYKCKLDLGLGLIENSNTDDQALFEVAVEVKRLPTNSDTGEFSLDSEISIWQDILKLYGYRFLNDSNNTKLAEKVGNKKIMLTFSSIPRSNFEKFKANMTSKYMDLQSLIEWKKKNKKSDLSSENDLDFILKNLLKWKVELERRFLLEDCKLQLVKGDIIKTIEFLPQDPEIPNTEEILVVSLLYL